MPRPVPTTQTGSLTDNQHGTNDTLVLGTGTSPSDLGVVIHGDALAMYDDSRGGNDTLVGGANAYNGLFGDTFNMHDNARGGNDTLIGGAVSINSLFGDALDMRDNARGGDDTIISGAGTDRMVGDAVFINGVAASPTAPNGSVVTGADTFVFAPGNGEDFVSDFRQSDHDRIDVSAWGFQSLADLTFIDAGA